MNVLSYLRTALTKSLREKPREEGSSSRTTTPDNGDWDFGARQSPDSTMRTFTFPRPSKQSAKPIPPTLLTSSPAPSRPFRSRSAMPLRDYHSASPASASDSSHRVDRKSSTPSPANPQRFTEYNPNALKSRSVGRRREAEISESHASKRPSVPPPSPELPDESFVLVAAAASARESRKSYTASREEFAERRRKAHSMAAARLVDVNKHPTLRHASSAYTIYETPGASSSKTAASVPSTPANSSAFEDPHSRRSIARRTLVQSKRSLPQLHNVWESFLQEASEDGGIGGSTEINRQDSGSSRKTIRNGADLSLHASREKWRPAESHPPLPRHIPSASASSKLTVTTVASSMMSPVHSPSESSDSICTASPCKSADKSAISLVYPPPSRLTMLQRRSRIQGRGRGSVQTTSSSLEATTSSMSSLGFSTAGFSSMSSITSVEFDEDPESEKEDANDRSSRDQTQSPESNRSVYLTSSGRARSPRNKSSSGSISSSQPRSRNRATAPHTPSQTPNTTTRSLPPTPPLSRSSSQSRSPRSTPKPSGGQASPASSLPSTPFASSHANVQWRGASPATLPDYSYASGSQNPYGNFNGAPHPHVPGPGSVKSPHHNSPTGLIRVPSSSESSDACSTGCSTGEDVLSELEYYYPRRRSPGDRRRTGLPSSPAPTHRRRLAEQAVPRSKSASNIRLVARTGRESQFGEASSANRMELSPLKSASPSPSPVPPPSGSSAPRSTPENKLRLSIRPPPRSSSIPLTSSMHEHFPQPSKATYYSSQSLPPSPLPVSSFTSYIRNNIGVHVPERRTTSDGGHGDLPASAPSSNYLQPPPKRATISDSDRRPGVSTDRQRPPSRPGTASSTNIEWGYAL